ncbi:MAG: hypothetical protein CMJ86_05430, partial [Planctomycetes bacterium]|nr:hypothetical protein [Planctomycetota bacterium]
QIAPMVTVSIPNIAFVAHRGVLLLRGAPRPPTPSWGAGGAQGGRGGAGAPGVAPEFLGNSLPPGRAAARGSRVNLGGALGRVALASDLLGP